MNSQDKSMRCLIIGSDGESHVGGYFKSAAAQLGMDALFLNTAAAFSKLAWLNKLFWIFLGKRPVYLNRFSEKVFELACQTGRNFILVTGIAPLSAKVLKRLKDRQVTIVNYLTDDPFNPAHKAKWFLEALPHYTHIASQRKANMEDLKKTGCKNIFFAPFGYDSSLHYPSSDESKSIQPQADVVFIGGADLDRAFYFKRLATEGFNLALYGGYWNRFSELKPFWKKFASIETARQAVAEAKVAICLVREKNRDDNSQRTFEAAAMGGCLLLQATPYHYELFGKDMEAGAYFSNADEMVSQLKVLLSSRELRDQLRAKSLNIIRQGQHTYLDRLKQIIQIVYGDSQS